MASSYPGTHKRTSNTDAARMIPGYEIVREIANGGSGRVYEVRAPGGIAKAAKVVTLDPDNPLTEREIEGLRLIRSVRHPYLVSIDRVDVDDKHITLIMELADCSLREVQSEYLASGAPGIPRQRLVPWLVEAAEALDVLNLKYSVRHLDVKPENLFLAAEHLKVGDYGLAREAGRNIVDPEENAVTPAYAAPELFDSQMSPNSDQYSLAVVYMEMLTGSLPFRTSNLRQLALFHLTRQPDLTPISVAERPIVARALSRNPAQRFRSCLEFVEALVDAEASRPKKRPGMRAETIRAHGPTIRIPSTQRNPTGPSAAASTQGAAVRQESGPSQTLCFVTDWCNDDVRAAIKGIADGLLAEWFDFGETLAAYRIRDDAGSMLVGVRMFSRDAVGPLLLEATVTRHGPMDRAEFARRSTDILASLQAVVSARPDDGAGRRDPRVQIQRPMTLFPTTGPMCDVPIPCTAINSSSRGLGAVSLVPIDAGAVRIRAANRNESFPGRIVYCRPSSSGKNFLVGMELESATSVALLTGSAAPSAHAARA